MKKKLRHSQINKNKIPHQQACPTRNNKQSPSGCNKRTIDSNSNPHEEIKSNDIYIGKYKRP